MGSAERLTELLAKAFPATSLEAIALEFAPAVSKDVNPKVAKLSATVREEAAVAAAAFRSAEMWIRIKAPAVSDGNNFGVDVQNYVLSELQSMRGAMEAMTIGGRDYHWSRAQGMDKVLGDEKSETGTSEVT